MGFSAPLVVWVLVQHHADKVHLYNSCRLIDVSHGIDDSVSCQLSVISQTCISVVEGPTDFILARIDSLAKGQLYTLTSKWLLNSVMKSNQLCFDYHSHTPSNI